MNVQWHPCLLAEITPHDGPAPTGNHVWDDNNLAQKNISIVNAALGSDFAFAMVVGHEDNLCEYLILEVDRGRLPSEVQLFVDLVDPILRRRIRKYAGGPLKQPEPPGRQGEGVGARFGATTALPNPLALQEPRPIALAISPAVQISKQGWYLGSYDGREVVFLHAHRRPRVPVYGSAGSLHTVIVGGIVDSEAKLGEYEVVLIQRDPLGQVMGSAALSLTVGKA
jgi:hypothetical protein